jgi:hypothetical protein
MDIAAINRLLKSHCNLKSQEKKESRLQAGLLEISNFNPPIKIIKPKPYKKPIPANSAMNTHQCLFPSTLRTKHVKHKLLKTENAAQ